MNITVFGANGRVGTLVVRRALDQGHRVQAFVHSRDPFDQHPQLTVRAGDVTDAAAVRGAVEAPRTPSPSWPPPTWRDGRLRAHHHR